MPGKTNKSFAKRLKITARKKVLRRKPGQNHFNAKERRTKQLAQRGWKSFIVKRKALKQNLPFSSA